MQPVILEDRWNLNYLWTKCEGTNYVGSVDPLNKIAEVDVDTAGAFRYSRTGKAVGEDGTIKVESSAGDKLTYNQVRQK